MLRRPLVVANWKMHKSVEQSLAFGRELLRRLEEAGWDNTRELVICPTLPALWALGRRVSALGVEVGAQNLDPGREGAFTGAVSGYLLAEAGATYVIVGHSERRHLFGETDAVVADKVAAAVAARLRPILCIGETAAEREAGASDAIVTRQLQFGLERVNAPEEGLVVAYEPVWAIGSGRTPEAEEAGRMAAVIRRELVARWGESGRAIRILYGGSVNQANFPAFLGEQEIDGALVGGASLKVAEVVAMATGSMENQGG
jgi:triosephosphate isomerase